MDKVEPIGIDDIGSYEQFCANLVTCPLNNAAPPGQTWGMLLHGPTGVDIRTRFDHHDTGHLIYYEVWLGPQQPLIPLEEVALVCESRKIGNVDVPGFWYQFKSMDSALRYLYHHALMLAAANGTKH